MTKNTKPRVVIDSNVWISGLVFGGYPGRILELFIEGSILIVVSAELMSELRRKIIQKFPKFLPYLTLLESSILNDAIVVNLGTKTVRISRDLDDDKFIETALIGKCDYVISGDKDLLSLKSYLDIRIISPSEFISILK